MNSRTVEGSTTITTTSWIRFLSSQTFIVASIYFSLSGRILCIFIFHILSDFPVCLSLKCLSFLCFSFMSVVGTCKTMSGKVKAGCLYLGRCLSLSDGDETLPRPWINTRSMNAGPYSLQGSDWYAAGQCRKPLSLKQSWNCGVLGDGTFWQFSAQFISSGQSWGSVVSSLWN